MHRFFVDPTVLAADPVTLTGDLAHQLGRVLRCRPGDVITLLDDSDWAWDVELTALDRASVRGRILRCYQPATEPRIPIALYQALPKGKKLDWVLQKATELGVSAVVPMSTQHAVAKPVAGRADRWRKIIQEAAEQSGRARVPRVCEPVPFGQAIHAPSPGELALIACLHDDARSLRQVLGTAALDEVWAVSVYVGPEGGFSPDEVAQAVALGITPVSLGRRVLRTETAPLALLSVLRYVLGEMG